MRKMQTQFGQWGSQDQLFEKLENQKQVGFNLWTQWVVTLSQNYGVVMWRS